MQRAILERFPSAEIRVTLIWVDMPGADSEAIAREAAVAFSDPRVRHFHDPRRVVGTTFARDVFPGYLTQAASGLAEGDPLRLYLKNRPVASPLWDIYFFYGRGAHWNSAPPRPAHWIRQMILDREAKSRIWEDDFTRPPRSVDLVKEIGIAAAEWLSPPGAPPDGGR